MMTGKTGSYITQNIIPCLRLLAEEVFATFLVRLGNSFTSAVFFRKTCQNFFIEKVDFECPFFLVFKTCADPPVSITSDNQITNLFYIRNINSYEQNKHIQQIHFDSRRTAAVRCAFCAKRCQQAAAAYIQI